MALKRAAGICFHWPSPPKHNIVHHCPSWVEKILKKIAEKSQVYLEGTFPWTFWSVLIISMHCWRLAGDQGPPGAGREEAGCAERHAGRGRTRGDPGPEELPRTSHTQVPLQQSQMFKFSHWACSSQVSVPRIWTSFPPAYHKFWGQGAQKQKDFHVLKLRTSGCCAAGEFRVRYLAIWWSIPSTSWPHVLRTIPAGQYIPVTAGSGGEREWFHVDLLPQGTFHRPKGRI